MNRLLLDGIFDHRLEAIRACKSGCGGRTRYVGNDPLDRVDLSGLTAKWAGYGGKGGVPAAGFGAYGAGTLLTSGASNSTPTPFVMARTKSTPSFESPFLSGTKAFFGSISDSIVGGVTGLVTGEAGRQLGERAFQITVNNNGGRFNGQWGQVAYNIAGQMAGTHSMAEGMVGIDLASHEAVAAEDRVGRFVGGLGQFAGIAAVGAVMTRSAFTAYSFTNLPGSAAVSRVSSSFNSAAARVWSRVDDWAGVGKNAGTSVSIPRSTLDVVPDGVVYLRTDLSGGVKPYVGQSMSWDHYLLRQVDHSNRFPNSEFIFKELGRADAGIPLHVLEESWIRQLGGPTTKSNPGGLLSNKRYQMNDVRYRAASGTFDKP